MKPFLPALDEAAVAVLRQPNVVFAFDFDGTLAPLHPDREAAQLRPATRQRLVRLASRARVALISGRSRADLEARVRGIPVTWLIGNHGMEPGTGAPFEAARLDEVRARLRALAHAHRELDLEDKRFSFCLHFGARLPADDVRLATEAALAGSDVQVRLVPGIGCLNVVPSGAPNKGDALLALMAREHATAAFFAGDDVTDDDVFRLGPRPDLVTVRVGANRASAASFFLQDQNEIDALLDALVRLRP